MLWKSQPRVIRTVNPNVVRERRRRLQGPGEHSTWRKAVHSWRQPTQDSGYPRLPQGWAPVSPSATRWCTEVCWLGSSATKGDWGAGCSVDRKIKGGLWGGWHLSKDLNDGKEPLYAGLGKGKQRVQEPWGRKAIGELGEEGQWAGGWWARGNGRTVVTADQPTGGLEAMARSGDWPDSRGAAWPDWRFSKVPPAAIQH